MFALIILSLGLAMDAFAVSLVRGSTHERHVLRAVELGAAFGLAQGIMPLVGWGLGLAFAETFRSVDHWVAFALLVFLGGRMLIEAKSGPDEAGPVPLHSRLLGLATAAFATSIDAAAAGLTLPVLGVAVPVACFAIGAVTAVLCTLGYLIGSRATQSIGKGAEAIGGVVLIGLGIKILVEHTLT